MENYGKLYLIATPIGNLKDITLRAIETIFAVNILLCEDTRVTGKLINSLEKPPDKNKPQILPYHDHNEEKMNPQIIEKLQEGNNIGLISDAGTPLISDPGYKLVRECLEKNIKVEAIPGPSSILTALISSGFPPDKFLFIGYLPRKSGQRQNLFKNLSSQPFKHLTIIAFESPHRLIKSLEDFQSVFGKEKEIALCREMTKLYEEIKKDPVEKLISEYQTKKVKGEIVLVFQI